MTPGRRAELEAAFARIFGMPLEEGRARVRRLMGSFIRQGKFTAPMVGASHRVTLEERSFAVFAFFACLGVGDLQALGLEELPGDEWDLQRRPSFLPGGLSAGRIDTVHGPTHGPAPALPPGTVVIEATAAPQEGQDGPQEPPGDAEPFREGHRVLHRRRDLYGVVAGFQDGKVLVRYEWPWNPSAPPSPVDPAELEPS